MKLSEESFNVISKIVCGDLPCTPYMSGPMLVKLFNKYGFNDEYIFGDGGFLGDGISGGSRNDYTLMRLEMLNDTRELGELLNFILDERHYMDDVSFNKDLTFSVDYAATKINAIIKHDAYLFEKVDDIYKLKGLGKGPVSVDAHFDNIQNQIIQEIRQAKYLIWVAVAWFTDKVLFEEVVKKKQEGVNIQVIINDDETNKKYGFNYEKYFETVRVKKDTVYGVVKDIGNKDIMHEKFCIIDLETVIHGTYNWSSKAQYNDESISTTKNDIEYAKKFADRFIKIKTEAKNKP